MIHETKTHVFSVTPGDKGGERVLTFYGAPNYRGTASYVVRVGTQWAAFHGVQDACRDAGYRADVNAEHAITDVVLATDSRASH